MQKKSGKWWISLLACLTLCQGFTVSKSDSIEENYKVQAKKLQVGKVAVDKLNIRAGADFNTEVVAILLKGEKVIIEDIIPYNNVPTWLKIRAPQKARLYVAKKYVQKKSANRGIINDDKVNIRAAANLKSTIVNQLNKGAEVAITGEKDEFYEITPPKGTSLYVAKIYVDIIGEYKEPKTLSPAEKKIITQKKWLTEYNNLTDRITAEHSKDIAVRDYTPLIAELKKLQQTAPTPQFKNMAAERIAKLQEFQELLDSIKKKDIESEKTKLEAALKEKENLIEAKKKAIPVNVIPQPIQEEYSYKASGYLESTGLYFGRPAPYKLINNNKIVCFIRADKDLKKYLGKFVEVKGYNNVDSKGRNILELKEIKVLDDTF
jgi:uncharacterized protein YgiM (DUF1202 family)